VHRAMPWRKIAILRLATLAGKTAGVTMRSGAGILGAGLITLGAGLVYWPLACFVGGAFLLLLDHRTPG
jgi:hypothetical protein